jgi:hypothetical protein
VSGEEGEKREERKEEEGRAGGRRGYLCILAYIGPLGVRKFVESTCYLFGDQHVAFFIPRQESRKSKKISGTNKKSPKKTPKEEMLTQEITPAKNIYTEEPRKVFYEKLRKTSKGNAELKISSSQKEKRN